MGVKQGCPLSATLFGLFVNGLEQQLMDTLGHDAPSLQRQLNALQLFCGQRQLTVNLAKTKVVNLGSRATDTLC